MEQTTQIKHTLLSHPVLVKCLLLWSYSKADWVRLLLSDCAMCYVSTFVLCFTTYGS